MRTTSKGLRPAWESRSLWCLFLGDFVEVGAKGFPIDVGVQFGKEVIELINLGELVFHIEKRGRTVHAKLRNIRKETQRITHYKILSSTPGFLEMPHRRNYRAHLKIGMVLDEIFKIDTLISRNRITDFFGKTA